MGTHRHLCSLAVATACLAGATAAAETIDINVTEVPYRETYAFLGLDAEFVGTGEAVTSAQTTDKIGHLAFLLRMQSARRRTFELEIQLGVQRFSLKSLGLGTLYAFELNLGGRIFPLTPLFALKRLGIRPTGSITVGGYLGDGTEGLAASLTAGLAFSFGEDTTGMMIEAVYRPLAYSLSSETPVDVTPTISMRLGFFFGP
jgi:hypothetical protein